MRAAFAAVIEGARPVLDRAQGHQVQRAQATGPADARTVEGQADVRPVTHRQQPRAAIAGFLPSELHVHAVGFPAPVGLLDVQCAAIGLARAAGLAFFGMGAQLQHGLPVVLAVARRCEGAQQPVAVLAFADAEPGRVVIHAAQAQRGVQLQLAIAEVGAGAAVTGQRQ